MAKQKKAVELRQTFMVMEATSYAGGGFPAYMNMLMKTMQDELEDAGYLGPFAWTWGGGDGVTVPAVLICHPT